MPSGPDVVIPIVFPDFPTSYMIVDTPPQRIETPLGNVQIPPLRLNVNEITTLGHAGVLFFRGSDGLTKYFEYGRYDPEQRGDVVQRGISNLTLATSGLPTPVSLASVLGQISSRAGRAGRILGAYIEVPNQFNAMLTYAQTVDRNAATRAHPAYSALSNSCVHFMAETVRAGGASMPSPMLAPRPDAYIGLVHLMHPALNFSPGQASVAIPRR